MTTPTTQPAQAGQEIRQMSASDLLERFAYGIGGAHRNIETATAHELLRRLASAPEMAQAGNCGNDSVIIGKYYREMVDEQAREITMLREALSMLVNIATHPKSTLAQIRTIAAESREAL